ncbi:MAG: cation transporter [Paludibacteraceae bacterium]|nr:cation transporter [Paludibacteraceae bacterium]
MKTKLTLLMCVLMLIGSTTLFAKDKPARETAVFYVAIHCDGCVKKIEQNIAFEKGVKDMRINQKEQSVTITYDPRKTDIEKLKAAFEKIKKPVSRVETVK